MTRTIFIAAGLALAAVLPAIPAQAASTRTFVSSAGHDSNPCTITQPCASFAVAYAATTPSGIIAALDPGKYGPLTIMGPITINGYGWAAITGPANGIAITINANSGDKVALFGLEIDGANAPDSNGIQFNSGGSLNVQDSVIRNFGQSGIEFQPNTSTLSQLFVSNTLISDNGSNGVNITPVGSGTTNGVLDHVKMQNNGNDGLEISSNSGQTINVTVSDSVSANNVADGINGNFNGGSASVMVRNSTIANNINNGFLMTSKVGGCVGVAGFTIRVSRSAITGNGTGWVNATCSGVVSYGDNNIDGNGANNGTPPNPLVYH
jgi:hypothetical protein